MHYAMHYDIYLEKDGRRVATCGSYEADKDVFGYQVKVSSIYPEITSDNTLFDVVRMTDFRLVCETASRKIEYLFRSWDEDVTPGTEINGGIPQLYGMAKWRKETANKPELYGHEEGGNYI